MHGDSDGGRDALIASRFPVPEPVVDTNPEYVRGEAIVNAVKGYAGEGRARRGGAVAGRSRIGSPAEIHMEILHRKRPRTVKPVFGTAASHPTGACKVLAPDKGGGGFSRSRRNVTERAAT